MDIKEDSAQINVFVGESAKIAVGVEPEHKIDLLVGDAAKMDCTRALNYIKSGKAEIDEAVEDGILEFNTNANLKTGEFNTNATGKTNAFNQNATDKTTAFNDNATSKTGDFDANALSKTNTFNQNATDKTGDFNTNAVNKTQDFNDNYTAKKQIIDDAVTDAQGYASSASNSADLAKQWAIGDPSEPTGGSAKYWAGQSANMANRDLSNLTATGEAKFDAKQDVISDLSTIRSGAALGATAVQPADLATVATTGDYDDLLNKPTIPTVNDATLTITQGGVSKGTFTANASSNVTIDLDAGGGGSYTEGTGIDITSNTISVKAPTLTNKNTGNTYGIAISDNITGSTTSAYSTTIGGRLNITGGSNVAIGDQTKVDGGSIAIGSNASATGTSGLNRLCIAIGTSAKVTANNGIQLGYGTNSEANSFYVGTSTSNNWKMLGNDGLIPYARIPFDDVTQNASATAKETIVGWGMPDYSAGTTLSLTAGQTYTATYNQMICGVVGWGTSSNGEILVRTTNDTSSPSNIIFAGRGSGYDWGAYHLYLKKGQSIYIQSLSGTYSCSVYPLIGG